MGILAELRLKKPEAILSSWEIFKELKEQQEEKEDMFSSEFLFPTMSPHGKKSRIKYMLLCTFISSTTGIQSN
jgi:hypothetical protein